MELPAVSGQILKISNRSLTNRIAQLPYSDLARSHDHIRHFFRSLFKHFSWKEDNILFFTILGVTKFHLISFFTKHFDRPKNAFWKMRKLHCILKLYKYSNEVLWKHYVNNSLQSFRFVDSDFHQNINESLMKAS